MWSRKFKANQTALGRVVLFILLFTMGAGPLALATGNDCASRFARIRRGAVDVAMFVPRVGQAFVYDIGAMYSRLRNDLRAAPNNYARLRRLLITNRESPGQTGFLDFMRDPITWVTQPEFIRRPLGRVLGREVRAPRTTMAEIPSIVVGGAIIAYGVHIGFTEPTDHLNQVSLESLLRRRPMGRASLEAWIRAGHFSSSTEAYALLGAYERGLRAWHQGEVPLRADNFPLIENGFFGPLNSGEINSVLRALREIRSETRSADLDRLSGALSERGKEVFREFLRFDALLREEFNQATRELQQQPQGDVDEIFARRIAAALRNDRRWGEGSAYSAERRAILARALDPRVEIAGVSDLAWRARAISALERFSGLSATERSREYGEALRANNQERMQELALVEAARAGVEIRGLSRARDAEVASVLLAQRARNVRTGEAAFPAERLRRARMIDSFCERNDCSDQYETLFRPDFSAFTSVQSFRVGGREISIRNEMDAWEMIFHDPRFLLEAELKARGEDKDVSILTQFLTRLDAHQSLERIQDEVFARSPTQWREDPDAEIPKPAFAQFCRLLGHGRERSPANALFLSTRSTLDQLERTLSRDRFLACRAFLAGLNWDYQASLSHIASRVSSTTNAATRDRVRADMASLREDGAEAFMEAVQACRSNRIKVPPQDALRTLDCENTP